MCAGMSERCATDLPFFTTTCMEHEIPDRRTFKGTFACSFQQTVKLPLFTLRKFIYILNFVKLLFLLNSDSTEQKFIASSRILFINDNLR